VSAGHHHGHAHDGGEGHSRATLTSRAALASITMATFLLGLKIWASLQTGSVAMLGSLADTGLDLFASLVTLYGVRFAAQPADREHRFGHGKAEGLAALFQVVIIALSAIAIGYRAFERLVTVAIHADHVHYQSDVMLNLAVIAALGLDQYAGIPWADPVFGIAIAVALGWGAYRAASGAIDQLMDREWPEEKRQRFLEVAARHPELAGIHDLRTRSSGTMDFVQFHVWVDPDMTVAEAHRVMDEVEHHLEHEFPGTEILIHIDPEGHEDREGVLSAEIAEEATR